MVIHAIMDDDATNKLPDVLSWLAKSIIFLMRIPLSEHKLFNHFRAE